MANEEQFNPNLPIEERRQLLVTDALKKLSSDELKQLIEEIETGQPSNVGTVPSNDA